MTLLLVAWWRLLLADAERTCHCSRGKADIGWILRNVRFRPKADIYGHPLRSARKGALIRRILLTGEGRDHLLLRDQAGSRSRGRSRSREGAFHRARATPPPNLPWCCGDYRIDQRRCVFQSGPQASRFTPKQGSQSRDWQAPGGNGCVTPEQGSQRRESQESQAPSSIGRLTPEQKSQGREG